MSPHNVRISHNITGVVQRVRRSEMLSTGLRRRGSASSAKRHLRAGTPDRRPPAITHLGEHGDWEPPTPRPDDGKSYIWDENTTSWVEIEPPEA